VVVDDQAFGALVQEVKDLRKEVGQIHTSVGQLKDAYNQARGAAQCLSPFKDLVVSAVKYLVVIGAATAIAKFMH
jgi:hypothetical protein